ncbi:MAG: tRNA uridine-5-carboxymethylaminomethyl(34) synthesis GTPase MnmE [Bacteroidales bacterium]|jgi:tRNA modification GTPase|nr:tRNA uridine-5-carboxymethylaminomethyl(34) synthesis GTPase MnmE [Bacteroidales bacterium]
MKDTICAPATPASPSAIGVIRMSGDKVLEITKEVFRLLNGKKEDIKHAIHPKVRVGYIMDRNKKIIDQVVCTIFFAPRSYTGEDIVEISHHGSPFVQQQILQLLIENGARLAKNGEFSQRAFLNGKMNLSQTEAVADLIQSRSAIAHELAIQQIKGGYQKTLSILRKDLLDFLSLLEIELDFSEEDLEFAQREKLLESIEKIDTTISKLVNSFSAGNAFKNGIPIAIIGKPNAGKSTLFNAILNDERAIVSTIAGTTRDTIEESLTLHGIEFRFIDTAGVRKSSDPIEAEGIRRSFKSIEESNIIIYVVDVNEMLPSEAQFDLIEIDKQISLEGKKIVIVANKFNEEDLLEKEIMGWNEIGAVKAVAKERIGIDEIIERIIKIVAIDLVNNDVLTTNARHWEAMKKAGEALKTAKENIRNQMPTDIIASDIRESLHYLGEITGEVTTDELLSNIFSKFCIGK